MSDAVTVLTLVVLLAAITAWQIILPVIGLLWVCGWVS